MIKTLHLKVVAFFISLLVPFGLYADDGVTCWFVPGTSSDSAQQIASALSEKSGLAIIPKIASNYPELLDNLSRGKADLAYIGSFVHAILAKRGLGEALVQKRDGKEVYGGVMIYPKGADPAAILSGSPEAIAYATGASAGESSAKAATDGKASFGVPNHQAAAVTVKVGKAKAAFVKNWWWEANKASFPELDMYAVPGVSDVKNQDNVLFAATQLSSENKGKIRDAAVKSKEAFGAQSVEPFVAATLEPTLELMKKAHIDPAQYTWTK